jgi:hypothetical protein
MKNGYEFDYNYLLKIKKDCEFFKKSSIKDIYNFSPNCENDPFFLNLLQKDNNNNNNTINSNNANEHKYKYLTATEDTINNINECMFILDQEEMYFKISQNQINGGTNNNNANNDNNNNDDNEDNNNNNSYTRNNIRNQIGVNFQGNLENEISKLRSKNEYQNLFFNSAEMKEPLIINTNMDDNMNINRYEKGPKKIPETTSKELVQSFDYYDKIKTDIFNKEEIQNMQNNIHKPNSNKIVIYSKSNNNNQNKDIKKNNSLNLNFNKINKRIKNENDNNSLKISLNNANKGQNKKNYELNIKINKKNDDKKVEENNIDNTNNKNMNINTMKNEDLIICDDKDEKITEKTINCKLISILSLIDKKDLSNDNNTTKFNVGSVLFKSMNTLNINLLLNSLKNNDKYSINSQNVIISKTFKEITDSYKYIKKQSNNISNIENLQNIIKDNTLYLSDDNNPPSKTYAFLSSLININFNSLKSTSSIIYNNYKYNGIKIKSSKHIVSIEDDLVLYTIPTEDENIFIYICLYNEKIKEIIKKYDKNNNIFNGFSSFVNIISLYFDDDDNNNKEETEKMIWIPCFEIESQLICNKIPGYKNLNIKDNNNNKDMDIFEYDEIIKINMKPNISNENENVNINNINKDDDIIIENDFLFGLFHKEIKNKLNTPFISLTFIGKDNFIIAN